MASKRVNSETLDAAKRKKTKPDNGEVIRAHRVIENVLNESVDFGENSFSTTPSNSDKRKRISLSRSALQAGRKSLAIFAGKDTEEQDEPVEEEVITPIQFKSNLKSLHDINSKAFDPKRAFSYNFINIINSFIKDEKGNVDFKLIAQSLEAGTKVYTSKVDLMYRNTQKVSSSLAMATDDRPDNDDDDGILDGDDLDGVMEKKKKKKPKKKNANTIANPSAINGKFETNIEVDPLFHHLSSAFDVGNVNSLLMANLATDPSGKLLLDSNASLDFSSYNPIAPTMMMGHSLFNNLNDPFSTNKFITNQFQDYEFSNRDIDIDIKSTGTQQTEQDNLNYDFDINAEVENISDVDSHSLFGDDHFSQPDNHSAAHIEKSGENAKDGSILDYEAQHLLGILPNNEYEFFNKNFLRNQLNKMSKFNRPKIVLNTSTTTTQKPKRNARKIHNENTYSVMTENFECNKNSNKYAPSTLKKWLGNSSRFQLKNDYGFDPAMLKTCFTKPKTYFYDPLKKHLAKESDDNETNQHEENNAHNGSFEDDGVAGNDDFPTDFNQDQAFQVPDSQESENRFSDHGPVDALDIDYAKVAKKVDMKRVKFGMWSIIDEADTAEMTESMSSQETATSTSSTQAKTIKFSDLRQNLPTKIKSNLNDNLSTPISFVALLHLCNEKNLFLTPSEEMSDFVIQAPT